MTQQAQAVRSQWKQFAGVVHDSLRSVSALHGSLQWLVAERDGCAGSVFLCSGSGPFRPQMRIDWPPAFEFLHYDTGVLCGTALDPLAGADLWLGLWVPSTYGPPREADLALLRSKAGLLGSLLVEAEHRRRLAEELEHARREAETDELTGLYNRRGWLRVLAREQARCERYGSPCTLMVVDLDDLKAVNDRDGHCAGDRLICSTARVLAETVRQPDVVARTGGDEFALLLTETGALEAAAFLRRLRLAMVEARIAASIGWAERHPAENLQDTLCRADSDMYNEKRERAPATP